MTKAVEKGAKFLESVFLKAGNLVTRTVAGETIVVPVQKGVGDLNSIYNFNELGTRIWQLLDGKNDVHTIVRIIAAEYEVGEAESSGDIVAFLNALKTAGLIWPSAEVPPGPSTNKPVTG